jgi:hypothetical protein
VYSPDMANNGKIAYIHINPMNKRALCLLSLLTSVLAFHTCTPQPPPTRTLDEERFIEAYVALLELKARADSTETGSSASAARSKLLAELGTSETEFRETIDSYRSDPQQWSVVLERVVKRLEEKLRGPHKTSPP